MQYASENVIPVPLELGGESPKIFLADVDADDEFFDKVLEGFAMFALNQGKVCTCPSRALVQKWIYDKLMERAVARVKKIKQGHPLDMTTMVGARPPPTSSEDPLLLGPASGKRRGTHRRRAGAPRGRVGQQLLRRPDDPGPATTDPSLPRKRSSGPSFRSRSSRTRRMRSRFRMTRSTASALASGTQQ